MAALTGNSVASSYQGLIKFNDNGTVQPTTLKTLSDGTGGSLPLSLSQVETKFTSGTVVDFTGVTVNGLAGAGLVSGGQTDSMVSASTLTTTAATTLNPGGIGLGENVQAGGAGAVIIGRNGTSPNQPWNSGHVGIGDGVTLTQEGATAVGANSTAGAFATTVGRNSAASAYGATAVGYSALTNQSNGISIGKDSKSRANNCITIGFNSIVDDAVRVDTVCVGANSKAAQYSTALGANAFAVGDYAISIGDANTYASGAIAIGDQAQSATNGACVIGRNLTAVAWQDSTTVNQMAFANVANLNYIDQTAAIAGGVPTGGLYHTDGTVKIVY